MSGERTFLYSLLKGDFKLTKTAQQAIWARLEAIELESPREVVSLRQAPQVSLQGAVQAPSTLRNLEASVVHVPAHMAPDPPAVPSVGQTPQAAAALASRQQAISEALAGKIDKVTGRPRKF